LDDCIFCRIIAREAPATFLTQTNQVIVFLSLERHPLVVPKSHVRDIFTLSDTFGATIMREAIRLARAVKAGLRCDGVYLAQANEPAAGQDVFHFHLHIYPSCTAIAMAHATSARHRWFRHESRPPCDRYKVTDCFGRGRPSLRSRATGTGRM